MKLKLDDKGNAILIEKDGVKMPVYVRDDGSESPFDAAGTVATISRLNGEAKTHRERAEKAEGDLKTFTTKFEGITDAEAARKALATMKNLDDKKLVDAGEVEKVKAEAIKAVRAEFEPVVKERDTLKSQLDSHLIGGAFSRSKFIAEKFAAPGPAGVEIAQAMFGSRLKVEEGKVVGYDAQGNKLFSRVRAGELADAEEAIELMVEAHPHKAHFLKGAGGSGAGAGGNGGGQGGKKTMTRAAFDALDPVAKSAAVKDTVITD
jgi:hypothetical protein